ncbi:MAG: sugar phosphate isomerase/epimerase [Oscillospiraceae bacterium]|nr:sugar phosphate isomerase/epimerase [Oscillospiraceae bacterium]
MKIGVRAHDFGCLEPAALAKALKDSGFGAAQLALTKAIAGVETIYDPDAALLENIRKEFEQNNVEISVLGCYMEIGYLDKDERLQEVDKFKKGIEHAKVLGAKCIGTETTRFPMSGMEHMREQAYLGVKDSVLRMAEHAERFGVDIALEPVADHTLNTAQLTKRLQEEVGSKRIKIIFDPVNQIRTKANMQRQEEIYANFFEILGNDIVALHVKDIVLSESEEEVWRNIGCGDVNNAFVFDWMRKNKPDISALREHVMLDSYNTDVEAIRRLIGGNV